MKNLKEGKQQIQHNAKALLNSHSHQAATKPYTDPARYPHASVS